MCDCCKKIIVRNEIPVVGPTGPQGPTGLTGPQGIQGVPGTPGISPSPLTSFIEITRSTIGTSSYTDFSIVITDTGDYVIQLEYYGQTNTGFTSLTTDLILDLGAGPFVDITNINAGHVVGPALTVGQSAVGTYTHTAKIRGMNPTNTAGFRLFAFGGSFTLENGSITLTKLSA